MCIDTNHNEPIYECGRCGCPMSEKEWMIYSGYCMDCYDELEGDE